MFPVVFFLLVRIKFLSGIQLSQKGFSLSLVVTETSIEVRNDCLELEIV